MHFKLQMNMEITSDSVIDFYLFFFFFFFFIFVYIVYKCFLFVVLQRATW